MCSLQKEETPEIIEIYNKFESLLKENAEMVNFYPNLLKFYVSEHQFNLLPSLKVRFISQILDQLNSYDIINTIESSAVKVRMFIYLNEIEVPVGSTDYIDQIMTFCAKIMLDKSFQDFFVRNIFFESENNIYMTNSSLVSIYLALEYFLKNIESLKENDKLSSDILSFIYSVAKTFPDNKNTSN